MNYHTRDMKQGMYISAFVVLGLLVATIVHAVIEIPTLIFFAKNIDAYGNSFVWQNWAVIHKVGGIVLWLLGALAGLLLGRRYWRIVYVEKRRGKIL